MQTKDRILLEALNMFSDKGFESVSIRDIASAVGIKESSIYYHLKNKQDILDSLVLKFENHITALVQQLNSSVVDLMPGAPISAENINHYYFEQYLFDPFCNRMLRFFMLEQFHSRKMAQLYDYYLFELPYKYQMGFFLNLSQYGIMDESKAKQVGDVYYATMTMLTFKYALNGELTEEKKAKFLQETEKYMSSLFGGDE